MKPLSAVTAPIIARIRADRDAALDRVEAEIKRTIDQHNDRNKRPAPGREPTQPNGRESA